MTNYPDYVKPSDGAKILGVESKLFFYYAKKRNVRTKSGDGERKTLYNYEDLLRISKEIGKGHHTQTVIDWVKPSDIPATVALDFIVYQEATIADINHYLSWVKKNPFLSLAVFDANERKNALAYITLLPLPEPTILDILRGNRSEMDIQANEIETYDRPGAYHLLAESAVTHPNHPEQLGKIMNALTDFWYNWYPERYIDKIYARPISDKGDILIQKLYFAARYDIAETAFMLDFKRPGASRFIRNFQQRIRNKHKTLES